MLMSIIIHNDINKCMIITKAKAKTQSFRFFTKSLVAEFVQDICILIASYIVCIRSALKLHLIFTSRSDRPECNNCALISKCLLGKSKRQEMTGKFKPRNYA